jgi:hypothetical protein
VQRTCAKRTSGSRKATYESATNAGTRTRGRAADHAHFVGFTICELVTPSHRNPLYRGPLESEMPRSLPLRPLGAIARRLLDPGRDARCPVAVIENGTTDTQRTIVAPLATTRIADEAAAAGLQPDTSRFRSHPRSSGSSTWTFTVDLPPNQLGPGWRRKAG